jgi:hypothetical protein
MAIGILSPCLAQRCQNGEVHGWYRCVHGFADHLVGMLLDKFGIHPGEKVFDPFCGTGTTLVECIKRGIYSVGIDANPASCFVSKVKTTAWNMKRDRLLELLDKTIAACSRFPPKAFRHRADTTYRYLEEAGMLKRGWISEKPLVKAIALKGCIKKLPTTAAYKNTLMLALVSEVIRGASNVRFGPELYCGPRKNDWDVNSGFADRVRTMAQDIETLGRVTPRLARVIEGDARECNRIAKGRDYNSFSATITSPPYPAEHDYTRNTRLELAFLEMVTDRSTLRAIKKIMLRSHTKGIYKEDNDKAQVQSNKSIDSIVKSLETKIRDKNHGFARLYPTVIQEYFGGMIRHFRALNALLRPGAKCAYVVGDQSAYLQVHIPTAEILAELVEQVGYTKIEIVRWRSRWSTSTSKQIHENILLFQKP